MPLTYEYRGFTLIDPSYVPTDVEAERWGIIEDTHHNDVIDWIGTDCLSIDVDVTNGHRHGKIYNGYGFKAFDSNNTDGLITIGLCDDATVVNQNVDVVIGTTISRFLVKTVADVELFHIDPDSGDINIGPSGTYDINITPKATGNAGFKVSSGNFNYLVVDKANEGVLIGRNNGGSCPTVTIGNPLHDTSIMSITPFVFEATTGEAYSRRRFSLAHTTVGISSTTVDDVEISKMSGGTVEMRINIAGTGSELYRQIVVPFTVYSGDTGADGCVLGLVHAINNETQTLAVARFEVIGVYNMITFKPYDGDYTSWEGYGASSISGRLSFTINEPNFTNSL